MAKINGSLKIIGIIVAACIVLGLSAAGALMKYGSVTTKVEAVEVGLKETKTRVDADHDIVTEIAANQIHLEQIINDFVLRQEKWNERFLEKLDN